jgi:hypothetical protein
VNERLVSARERPSICGPRLDTARGLWFWLARYYAGKVLHTNFISISLFIVYDYLRKVIKPGWPLQGHLLHDKFTESEKFCSAMPGSWAEKYIRESYHIIACSSSPPVVHGQLSTTQSNHIKSCVSCSNIQRT